jgi:hypothetical protein
VETHLICLTRDSGLLACSGLSSLLPMNFSNTLRSASAPIAIETRTAFLPQGKSITALSDRPTAAAPCPSQSRRRR